MIDNYKENIYNTYLSVSRKINNKPFQPKKNFKDIENTEKDIALEKLKMFFIKFNEIKQQEFFEAPYFIFNEKFFDLNFYCSYKAIKAYSHYYNNYILGKPDSDKTIEKYIEGFKFIYKFCKNNNVNFYEYITLLDNSYPSFLIHLKERKILFYNLFIFENINSILSKYTKDELNMFSNDFDRVTYLRSKYYSSKKLFSIATNLKNNLKNNKNILK